jgi:hypothetical protein
MLRLLRISAAVLGVAGLALISVQPAEAACQLVKATHSSTSKADAAKRSQALVMQSARELQRARGWRSISLRARRVKGDPFWKAVRPGDPPADALMKPDIVTGRFYTTCFTGVVVPVVCTTGSAVCGN